MRQTGELGRSIHRLLVVGFPRSGTTWIGQGLAACTGWWYVSEPDNHWAEPYALRAKMTLGRGGFYPPIEDFDTPPGGAEYERLWVAAFGLDDPGSAPSRSRVLARRIRRGSGRLLLQRWGGPHAVRQALLFSGGTSARIEVARRIATPSRPRHGANPVIVKSVYALLSAAWISRRCRAKVCVVLRDPRSVIACW